MSAKNMLSVSLSYLFISYISHLDFIIRYLRAIVNFNNGFGRQYLTEKITETEVVFFRLRKRQPVITVISAVFASDETHPFLIMAFLTLISFTRLPAFALLSMFIV